jgi:DNA adenine methylase
VSLLVEVAGPPEPTGIRRRCRSFPQRVRVPFAQWGSASRYAHRLVPLLPPHRGYGEPFCGAAALFFAKPKASFSVLSDLDQDVIFALRFIQHLTPRRWANLHRLSTPWRVSREGFELSRSLRPKTPEERFWKFVYGRLCTWGGLPKQRGGYGTNREGQLYPLGSLWKFHTWLQGVRISRQDWRKTIRDFDGPEMLWFLDPPYLGEWSGRSEEEVSPAALRQGLAGLKGQFLIAYTDSDLARKEFADLGHCFALTVLEGGHRDCALSKRSRLFVASWRPSLTEQPKDVQLEWLT